jgi:hypothetical protein
MVCQFVPVGRRVGTDDAAGLELLLQPPQLVGEEGREVAAAPQLRGEGAELAERRVEDVLDDELRAAIAGRVEELDAAAGLVDAPPDSLRRDPRRLDVVARLRDRDRLPDPLAALRLAALAPRGRARRRRRGSRGSRSGAGASGCRRPG